MIETHIQSFRKHCLWLGDENVAFVKIITTKVGWDVVRDQILKEKCECEEVNSTWTWGQKSLLKREIDYNIPYQWVLKMAQCWVCTIKT